MLIIHSGIGWFWFREKRDCRKEMSVKYIYHSRDTGQVCWIAGFQTNKDKRFLLLLVLLVSGRCLLQLTLQVLDVVDRGEDGFQVRRRGSGYDGPQPRELLGRDVHQHLPPLLLHLAARPPRLLPDCRPLLPQVWGGRRGVVARPWRFLHTNHLSSQIWDSSSSFKLHEVLLRCFLSYNWSESSCTPAYINCRPVLRSHWSKLSRAETESSDWSSAGVVVWNYYGIPLHRGTAA